MPTPRQTTTWLLILALGLVGFFTVTVLRNRPATERPDRPVIRATDFRQGPDNAAVTIVEFGDAQCTFCQKQAAALAQVLAEKGSQVRYVWKDLPLSDHLEALPAAIAARCAGEQGRFWEYHDALLQGQTQLGEALYHSIAADLKLDADRFSQCRLESRTRSLIDQDVAEARALGIATIPTTFINDQRFTEVVSAQNLTDLITAELASPSTP